MADEYDQKFAEMQKYIPFLEAMIDRLQNPKDRSREVQLHRMQQLHGILTSSKRKLKIETLKKCEDVLQKLHNKVEKGTTAGLNFPKNKKVENKDLSQIKADNTAGSSSINDKQKEPKMTKDCKMDDGPASPSPPASPDEFPKSMGGNPIIIPTESKHDYTSGKEFDKPASPEHSETVPTKNPIIIPTERKKELSQDLSENVKLVPSKENNYDDWNSPSRSTSNNTSKKLFDDPRIQRRHIPTVPVPLSGVRRNPNEKNRSSPFVSNTDNDNKVDYSLHNNLGSPETRSPMNKEIFFSPKRACPKPAPLLLVSPPQVPVEPPLSIEDLTELLNDGSAENVDNLLQKSSHLSKDETKRSPKEKATDYAKKQENDADKILTESSISSKNFVLTQHDIDRESERRWEKVDKHIVKFRKTPSSGKSEFSKSEAINPNSANQKRLGMRDSPISPTGKDRGFENYESNPIPVVERSRNTDRPTMPDMNVINSAFSCLSEGDIANLVQTNLHIQTEGFPMMNEREAFPHRGPHNSSMDMYARTGPEGSFCREEPDFHENPDFRVNPDFRRENTDFHRDNPEFHRDNPDFHRENPDFHRDNPEFHRIHRQPMPMHQPGNREFCNPQWGGPNHQVQNVRGNSYDQNPPQLSPMQQSYAPHPANHPDMWNMGPNPGPATIDNVPPHHIPNQFGPGPNRSRPMISPPRRPPDINKGPCEPNFAGDPHQNPQMIPSLMSAPIFNPPIYRNPNYSENRNFEQQFDRSGELPHGPSRPQWENSINRPIEPGFHDAQRPRVPDGPRGGPPGRARIGGNEPANRGRQNDWFPERPTERLSGDRRTAEQPNHHNFNRRPERPERADRVEKDRSLPPDNANRFHRESRINIENSRDPRFRQDQALPQVSNSNSSSPSTSTVRRDPRLAKDSAPIASILAPPTKPKEIPPTTNSRDPRCRISQPKESLSTSDRSNDSRKSKGSIGPSKGKETTRSSDIKSRRSSEENKGNTEKSSKSKETMQSPLESLYGVVDTTVKTGKGYGLQKFKIPKIKRPEITPRPPTPPKPSASASVSDIGESWEKDDSTNNQSLRTVSEPNNVTSDVETRDKRKDKKSEVSSTTDLAQESEAKTSSMEKIGNQEPEVVTTTKCTQIETPAVKKKVKKDVKIAESEAEVDISASTNKPLSAIENNKTASTKDSEGSKLKGEVTQEWIESLIRMSLDSGERNKLLEQAKLLQKLGEALQTKKIKKIQKIIESESETSSSDSAEFETKKPSIKKKRRVIVSESSEDECLADRLIAGSENSKVQKPKAKQEKTQSKTKKKVNLTEEKEVPIKEKIKVKVEEEKKVIEPKQEKTVSTAIPPKEPEILESQGKAKKFAKKRRNSLEMLQEDIREMFISNEVVTATGHRMCRTAKEVNPQLTVEHVKETYGSRSPERHEEAQSEDGEIGPKLRRTRCKTPKPVTIDSDYSKTTSGRTIRKRAAKTSKKYATSSSESDEEHSKRPVPLSTTAQNLKDVSDPKVVLIKSTTPTPEGWDLGPVLRRSGRTKEPKQRTDASKIDSEMMFDSSSDYSLGIDVSGLAEAVDISLHSERQAAVDNRQTSTGNLKKENPENVKLMKKKSLQTESNESKVDTFVKGDDDMASDISISSSNASSVKKITSTSAPVDVNEELITNILDEFGNDKDQKADEVTSDLDVDGEAYSRALMKKPKLRRKKKRKSWRMGIVTKKKKKKQTVPCSDLNPANESADVMVIENEVDSWSVSMDKVIENVVNNENPLPCSKENNSSKLDSSNDVEEIFPKDDKPEENYENSKMGYDLKTLIEYAWTGQEKYACLICNFSGKNIVHHYKHYHSKAEIMISRLSVLDSKRAIDESRDETFIKLSQKVNSGPRRKFRCRFCVFNTEGEKEAAIEAFYEHCTTHTGEYRFKCKSCPYQTIGKSSMRTHYYKYCRKNFENFNIAFDEDPIAVEEQLVRGYLCSACNFIQLKKCNVEKHIKIHHKNVEIKIIKINMSSYFGVNELNDSASGLRFGDDSIARDDSDLESKIKKEVIDKVKKNEESPTKSISDESENSSARKLSAFVCAPDLENKEDEIQLERKKKMQEILNNFKTKFLKDSTEKGLSIIDQLKDKMKTKESDPSADRVNIDEEESDEHDDESESRVNLDSTNTTVKSLNDSSVMQKVDNSKSTDRLDTQDSDSIITVDLGSDNPKNEPIDLDESTQCDSEKKMIIDPLIKLEGADHITDNSEAEISDDDDMSKLQVYESDTSDDVSDSELPTDVNSLLQETINATTNPMMNLTIQRLAAQLQGAKNVSVTSEGTTENVENYDEEEENEKEKLTEKNDASKLPNIMPTSNLKNYVETQKFVPDLSMDDDYDDKDSENSNTPKNFIRLRRLSGDKLSSGLLISESPPPTPGENSSENPAESQSVSEQSPTEALEEKGEDDSCSFFKIENVISLAPNVTNREESPLIDDIRKAVGTSPVKVAGISVLKKSSPNILKRKGASLGKIDSIMTRFPAIAPHNPMNQALKKFVVSTVTVPMPIQPKKVITPTHLQPIAPTPKSLVPIQLSTKNKVLMPVPTSSVVKQNIKVPNSVQNPSPPIRPVGTTSKSIIQKASKAIKLPTVPNGKNYKIVKVVRAMTCLKPKDNTQNATPKLKTSDAYVAMLQVSKLRQLYKCMSRSCTFSTDSYEQYGKHFQQHADTFDTTNQEAPYDYQKCAYCHEAMSTWEDMFRHYKIRHSFCAYQCGYCFYRAVTQSYVELHQISAHYGKPHSVILGTHDVDRPPDHFDRRETIIPFVCKHECGKVFYVPDAFIRHLNTKHGAKLSIYNCHLCPASVLKPEALIAHYKMHVIYKYQCLYCLFGSDGPLELHRHLSAQHAYRAPNILERCLPGSPLRDQDVLLQLKIRNVDNDYKCSELKRVSDTSLDTVARRARREVIHASADGIITGAPIKRNPQRILPRGPLPNINPTEVIDLLDNDQNNEPRATISNLFMHPAEITANVISDSAKIAPVNKPTKTYEKNSKNAHASITPCQSSNIKSDRKSVTQNLESTGHESIDPEPELKLRYSNEASKTNIISTVDPLAPSEEDLNCNDEFISINLLDNPDFLKSAEERAAENLVKGNEDKNDDSDIEILEFITPSNKSQTQTRSSIIKLAPKDSLLKTKEELKKGDVDNKLVKSESSSIVFNSNENSNPSVEMSISSDNLENIAEKKESEILSLEDIKHTGFTGKDLFKCGYDKCDFTALDAENLKLHMKQCSHANEQKIVACTHCNKRFLKIGFLIDHFKVHGLKRFGCSLCNVRYATPHQAMAHLRSKHKFTNGKLVPADPTNPSVDGLFNVHVTQAKELVKKGKKGSKGKGSSNSEKTCFSPADIDVLPRQAIYNREVKCAVCPYTTKVRTNIIRHLQLHAKDETVPETGPVNPVPCLDKKEKMFDKMVNLASSSHQNGRMSTGAQKTPKKEAVSEINVEGLPKFVPEHNRYICGVNDCNYLTIDEAMLRSHMKALHSDETYYRCPHCPPLTPGQDFQNIIIDKLGIHLKMHDTRLYKCSHCNYHHYQRHVVERHLSDKHAENQPYVMVIREIDTTKNSQQLLAEEPEDGVSDPDGNHWKCNMCEYKCAYKSEMIIHAGSAHDEKSQFKCTICPYKSSGKIHFEQHILSKHINDATADYTMSYEKVKGMKKATDSTVVSEQQVADEPFDTTPLWRRDMPRIRHIRGILFEEENDVKNSETTPVKSGKRKNDVETLPKSVKAKTKPISQSSTSVEVWASPEKKKNNSESARYSTKTCTEDNEDEGAYGPYGKPMGNLYTCTICDTYTTKYKQDIKDHLFRELYYWRWHCKGCGYLAVSHSRLIKHINNFHKGSVQETVTLETKSEIEGWVKKVINRQRSLMPDMIAKAKIPPAILENSENKDSSKTVNLAARISNLGTTSTNDSDADDDDDALVIDSKDDSIIEQSEADNIANNLAQTEAGKQEWTCKHCQTKFTKWRGFKLHVQVNHLQRLAFLCPYCDRSTNAQATMAQHIRSKHAGLPEDIIKNPSANAAALSNAFWEKEYGLIIPKKSKKRKRQLDIEAEMTEDRVEIDPAETICATCGFTAINAKGLRAHMRAHANRHCLKCAHCSFTANSKDDVWQHTELNHPHLESWEAVAINVPGSSTDPPTQYIKKRIIEDYNEDIEEETVPTSPKPENKREKKFLYSCYYCDGARSLSLSSVEDHWAIAHKEPNKSSKSETGVPFRYKKTTATVITTQKLMKCSYCPKKGSFTNLRTHIRKKHPNLPYKCVEPMDTSHDIWICRWCRESVEGLARTAHHNMFHSHLPVKFKREVTLQIKQKGYACPECDFVSPGMSRMRKHVSKHVDLFKCKRCGDSFPNIGLATHHSTIVHPGLAASIEGIATNIELIMAKVSRSDVTHISEDPEPLKPPLKDIFRNSGVAKKSTTKQILRRPSTSPKNVARKSTTSIPRYPPGMTFDIDFEGGVKGLVNQLSPQGYSYYGKPKVPVNLGTLNTTMAMGSAQMKVECTTLAQFINIEPEVIVEDIVKSGKHPKISN